MKIPLFCHNSSGYDSHFIIDELPNDERITHVRALPYNTQKFRTIEINHFKFLDSASFLNAKLDDLANDLKTVPNFSYKILDQLLLYEKNDLFKKNLLLRKGCFCYEYVTSVDILKQTKQLPEKKYFFSKLKNSHVKQEDYEHAQKVYKYFDCKNLKDFEELYCITDCALLGEVLWNFREEIYGDTQLDCW